MFAEGIDRLAWDTDDLARLEKLHNSNLKDSDKPDFLKAGNLATFLGLHSIRSVHMPIPLNFIFVGFHADGHLKVNISHTELQEWFQYMDHVLPHTRLELGELTCSQDGHCTGLLQGSTSSSPVTSYVHLNFTCHIILVRQSAVSNVMERAIHSFSRPVDPFREEGLQQVDARRMERFMGNFISTMGLDDMYNIIVVNPKWAQAEGLYGYRAGFSSEELNFLVQNKEKVLAFAREYDRVHRANEPQIPSVNHGAWGKHTMPQPKFVVNELQWASDHWLTYMDKYLGDEEAFRGKLLRGGGQSERGGIAIAQAARVMQEVNEWSSLLYAELMPEENDFAGVRSKFRTAHPVEDCLVVNWVGNGRWMMIDLAATGHDWGPALGGDGVVIKTTIPSVTQYFKPVEDAKHAWKMTVLQNEGSKMEEAQNKSESLKSEFMAKKGERLGGLANRHWHAYQQHKTSKQSETQAPDGSDAFDEHKEDDKFQRHYQELMLQAELDLYEEFALNHCHQIKEPPLFCREAKESAERTRQYLKRLQTSTGSQFDLFREHQWEIFGDDADEELPEHALTEENRAKELFLAELGGILSRAIRHVIVPPTATWHHEGYMHDTATPFAKQVHFQLYVINDSPRRHMDGKKQASWAPEVFDINGFMRELAMLALPNQQFRFSQRYLNLIEEPFLATAFHTSLKSANQEIPVTEVDSIEEAEQVYLDSMELAHHLRRVFPTEASMGARKKAAALGTLHEHLEVPIFIFQLNRQHAILIDEHYNARAMEDLIMVVHNAAHLDEHPTGMMCDAVLLARPLSPLKQALSASLLHLAGVLPPHLGYNPKSRQVTHDWLWSVGAHPQSFTSVGLRYNLLQKDALARSYILDACDSAIDIANEGLKVLTNIKTDDASWSRLRKKQVLMRLILAAWNDVVETMRGMMYHSFMLDWTTATNQIPQIERAAKHLKELTEEMRGDMDGFVCGAAAVSKRTIAWTVPIMVGSAIIAAIAFVVAIWPRPGSGKPRYN